ncbi:MAG: serine hydrolase domain-containing protein [Pseudomonadota bacterium]
MKRYLLVFSVALITVSLWVFAPFYSFLAHRGKAPLPPWGWVTIDRPVPKTQHLSDPAFEIAGNQALSAMVTYREANSLPSLSAAVAINDRLVWAGTVGFSDIAGEIPATPDTLYRIGSTSKALTATALASLVERGELDLDAPISTYSSSAQNPIWSKLTARQLASHTAGTPHYGENEDILGLYRTVKMAHHYDDVRDALSIFDSSALLFPPGGQFHYSSLGTVLLGAVMSDAAGISYRALMRREVFQPAGMETTYPDGDRHQAADNLATFYYTDGTRFRPWRPVDLSQRLPGGGYISTPRDLVKVGGIYLTGQRISAETRDAFWTPQELADGSVNEQNYALGWRWREFEFNGASDVANANHGGVSRGSQCWLLIYPGYRMTMAFCTNTKTEDFDTFGLFYKPFFEAFADA